MLTTLHYISISSYDIIESSPDINIHIHYKIFLLFLLISILTHTHTHIYGCIIASACPAARYFLFSILFLPLTLVSCSTCASTSFDTDRSMGRPSRSEEHPPPHVEAQIEAATRDYFHHLAPKRHAKPSRSDPNVDALLPPPAAAADAPNNIPELAKFQDLEAHSQKIACESDGRAAPTEEYMATDYYDDLNGMDKQHHTTGSGFINCKVEGGGGGASEWEWEWNVKKQNARTADHNNNNNNNNQRAYASQGKGNPATNDWIPSAHPQTPHTVSLESSKPHRSDN